MFDVKKALVESAKSGKIHSYNFQFKSTPDSRLHILADVDVSVDLPGELDALAAGIASKLAALLGVGNFSAPSNG
jgi:hypothetical protein